MKNTIFSAGKLAALLPAALFALNTSAAELNYFCKPQTSVAPGITGHYEARPFTKYDTVRPMRIRISGREIAIVELGRDGQVLRELAAKTGNLSSCYALNEGDAKFTVAENAYTPDVYSIPAAAFEGEQSVQVGDVLDEDADGMACHGYTWSCELLRN